jgi:hypothetical protein
VIFDGNKCSRSKVDNGEVAPDGFEFVAFRPKVGGSVPLGTPVQIKLILEGDPLSFDAEECPIYPLPEGYVQQPEPVDWGPSEHKGTW